MINVKLLKELMDGWTPGNQLCPMVTTSASGVGIAENPRAVNHIYKRGVSRIGTIGRCLFPFGEPKWTAFVFFFNRPPLGIINGTLRRK